MKNVQRYERCDSYQIVGSAVKDNDGFMRDTPIVARTGIYTYLNEDGSVRKEYRPPSEVFADDSLDSFIGKPIVVDHPKVGKVTSETAQELAIGSILSRGAPRFLNMDTMLEASNDNKGDQYVSCDIVLFNPDAIGDRRELSLGYRCDIEEKEGVAPNGETYNFIQRNIRVNHLAVVNKARAGMKARLNCDGDEYICCDDDGKKENLLNANEDVSNKETDYKENGSKEIPVEKSVEENSKENEKGNTQLFRVGEVDENNSENKPKENNETKVTEQKVDNSDDKKEGQRMSNLRIDNVDYEVSDTVIAHINALQHRIDAAEAEIEAKDKELENKDQELVEKEAEIEAKEEEINQEKVDCDKMKKDLDEVQEKINALTEERDALQGKLEAAEADKEKAVAEAKEEGKKEAEERAEVLETAEQAGVDVEENKKDEGEEPEKDKEAEEKDVEKKDGMSNLDIKKLIVEKVYQGSIKLDGKSASFIDGVYQTVRQRLRNDAIKEQIVTVKAKKVERNDGAEEYKTASQRRAEMIARQRGAYKSAEKKF